MRQVVVKKAHNALTKKNLFDIQKNYQPVMGEHCTSISITHVAYFALERFRNGVNFSIMKSQFFQTSMFLVAKTAYDLGST